MFNQLLVNLMTSNQILSVFQKVESATEGFNTEMKGISTKIFIGGIIVAAVFAVFKGDRGPDYVKGRIALILACTALLASAPQLISTITNFFN